MRSAELARALLGPLSPPDLPPVDPIRAWAASGGMWLTGRPGGFPLADGNGAAAVATTLLNALAATSPAGSPTPPRTTVLGERAAVGGLARGGDRSPGGGTRLLPTVDGHIALSLTRPEDVELVPALVSASVGAADPWDVLTKWAAKASSAEVVSRGRLLGLAVAGLGESRVEDSSPAVRWAPGASRLIRPRPLVVDLTSLWAGPLCAHLLARAGAEVVKVESTRRPDGARRGPAKFFNLLHARSRSVTVDFSSHKGRAQLRALVAQADVVLTSSRLRALEHLGLDLHSTGAIWVAITAHGLDEGVDRIGFGDDVAVAAGLVGADERGPVFVGDAIADPLTGLAAAAATSAMLLAGTGGVVDIAMVRVAGVAARASRPPDVRIGAEPPTPRYSTNPAPALGADNGEYLNRA